MHVLANLGDYVDDRNLGHDGVGGGCGGAVGMGRFQEVVEVG